jgi:Fe-S-cluster-containing dehydrogenase component
MDVPNESESTSLSTSPVSDSGCGNVSRRTFLRASLTGGLLIVAGAGWVPLSRALATASNKYALIIDLNECTGCGACEQACNQRNNLPEGKSFIRRISKGEGEDRWCLPVQCQHCQDAPCIEVCPTKATYRHPSGVVLVNEKTCVGCKYCAVACPYNARTFDEHTGVVNKCWLCLDWVLRGEQPACVQACVTGARIFGHRDDAQIVKVLNSGRARSLHPEFGTKPGIVQYIFPGD